VSMPTLPLPAEPSLEQLRNQARELKRAVRSGEPEALAEVAERHPQPPIGPIEIASFQLTAAQLVIARRYDFDSWTRLKRHIEVVERYSRFPNRLPSADPADLAGRFLRQACLSYEDVGPTEWAQARALLAEHPEITAADVYAAAAVGDTAALARVLAVDPAAASREGGPYRWEPLMYLAYARHDPAIGADAVLGAARLLLNAGADPNAGYLWNGLPTPFTVLTGVFGEGERGPTDQPRHPHSLALARVLLEAGADPNDGQALYNRMFLPDDDHLELLFEFGLGTGDGGPWKRRMGDALDPPAAMLRGELRWAITHGMAERVRLLAEHGVDLLTPYEDGTSTTAMAATTGHPELIEFLVSRGVPQPELSPEDAFVAAVLAVDRRCAGRATSTDSRSSSCLSPSRRRRHIQKTISVSPLSGDPRTDSGDPFDRVPDDVPRPRRGRELGLGRHVDLRQPVEQVPRVLAGLDGGAGMQHGVRIQKDTRLVRRVERQHRARVALDVAHLLGPAHVAADDLVTVQPDPDHGHLRAAVGVDRGQVRQRTGCDQVPKLGWQRIHG
jgi:hypothetical protein